MSMSLSGKIALVVGASALTLGFTQYNPNETYIQQGVDTLKQTAIDLQGEVNRLSVSDSEKDAEITDSNTKFDTLLAKIGVKIENGEVKVDKESTTYKESMLGQHDKQMQETTKANTDEEEMTTYVDNAIEDLQEQGVTVNDLRKPEDNKYKK